MGFVLSVVINDFDGVGFFGMPAKADAPLTVNSDAQLSVAVAFQSLKVVARWVFQVVQRQGGVELAKFSKRSVLDVLR
jgi:hypothetical protein